MSTVSFTDLLSLSLSLSLCFSHCMNTIIWFCDLVLILILLYIHIVTYATLDLSNYILQNYNTCTKSQNMK